MNRWNKLPDPWKICIGCDPNPKLMPQWTTTMPPGIALKAWNKQIIEAVAQLNPVIKFQVAWFERLGSVGYQALEESIYFAQTLGLPVIADIKRGDIGASNDAYAQAWFHHFAVDAITVNPWLGAQSLAGILEQAGSSKTRVYATLRTSNPQSDRVQEPVMEQLADDLYEVASQYEGAVEQLGFVIGADQRQAASWLLKNYPHAKILVPGFGAQGGSTKSLNDFLPNSGNASASQVLFSASRSVTFPDLPHPTDQENAENTAAIKAAGLAFNKELQLGF